MNYRKIILGLLLITCTVVIDGFITSDGDIIENIVTRLDQWYSNNPVEKVYLQLDKPYYVAGDDVWFKAYVTLGEKHKLSGLSGVLNVELIDDRDSVKQHIKLPIVNGVAWGDVALPGNIQTGYRIRAYTNYMRNAGDAYFFDRRIATLGVNEDKETVKKITTTIDVQFFPEGGGLVNGVNSKVAFKVVGADGAGADIKGEIIDDKNDTITTFNTQHLGMGKFNFTPLTDVVYKAHIVCKDGSAKVINLPGTADKGYVLSVDADDPEQVRIKISAGGQNPNDTLSLIAQAGGKVYYAAKSNNSNKVFISSVNKSRFPSGIVQFTLFSGKGEPLNERLVFIQNNDGLKLNVGSDKLVYAPRENAKINLNVLTVDDKPAIGSFSVAVTDEAKLPVNENAESSILANLLLTSDLRGYIEQPNYYFNKANEKTRADLDVLMLTQGYHRFEWKKILNNEMPTLVCRPEKGLEITGQITTPGGKPVAHGKVTLLSTQSGFFSIDTVADENGKFVFKNLAFGDSVKFIIQARTAKNNKDVDIKLDNMIQDVGTHKITIDSKATYPVYLKNTTINDEPVKYDMARAKQLKQVDIKSTTAKVTHSSNLNGPGNADQVLTGNEIPRGSPTIFTALQGRLTGVTVMTKQDPKTKITRTSFYNQSIGDTMAVSLDGISISNAEIYTINPYDVESVEVLKSIPYFLTYLRKSPPGGIIVITTKNRDDYAKEDMTRSTLGSLRYSPIGYYKAREFYSPQYNDPKVNTTLADARSTIYWNPNIVTDKNGNALFTFFNAGSKGVYRVIIEGMNAEGNIGRQVYRYKVE